MHTCNQINREMCANKLKKSLMLTKIKAEKIDRQI